MSFPVIVVLKGPSNDSIAIATFFIATNGLYGMSGKSIYTKFNNQ